MEKQNATTLIPKIFLFFVQIFFVGISNAQEGPNSSSTALAMYAEMPVNNYTGIGGASISLAQINGKELGIPVSISYHAAGLKVGQHPSTVGLGWSLNAGGVITRTVYGEPDEQGYFNLTEDGKTRLATRNYMDPVGQSDQLDFLQGIASGQIDTEPDAFYFNVGGRTGKFFFNPEGKAVLESFSNLSITAESGLSSITLVDETGTKYIFDKKEAPGSSKIMTDFQWSPEFQNSVTSWHLGSITSASGEKMLFEYEQVEYTETTWKESDKFILKQNFQYLHKNSSGKDLDEVGYYIKYTQTYGQYGYFMQQNGHLHTTYNQNNPKKISYEGGYITFSYSDSYNSQGQRHLDMISVYSWDGYSYSRLLNRICFEYGSYQNIPAFYDDEYHILRLRKVYSVNNAQEKEPPYVFDYATDILPSRFSMAQDHWGYYNGKTGNQTLIPTVDVDGITYVGADRQPDFEYAKYGILTKITYPTGSSCTFQYEPHKDATGNILSGGLRIKAMLTKDENNKTIFQKSYEYGDPVNYPPPIYCYPVKKLFPIDAVNNVSADIIMLTTFNNTQLGSSARQVFYRNVKEISGDINGKTKYMNEFVYHYNTDPNIDSQNYNPTDNFQIFPFPQLNLDHPLNGMPLKVINYGYDSTSNQYYKIKETENVYSVEKIRNRNSITGLKVGYCILAPYNQPGGNMMYKLITAGISPFTTYQYYINTYWSHLDETLEKTYPDREDGSKFIVTRTKFHYANHGKIARTETVNSEQVTITKKIKYAEDYQNSLLTDDQSQFILQMKLKNVLSVPIEEQIWQQKQGGEPELLDARLTAFHPVYFKPVKMWVTEQDKTVNKLSNEGYFMSDPDKYIPKIAYTYDEQGNIQELYHIDSKMSKSYYWNRTRQYLLAEASLAKPEQIFHTSFEEEDETDIVEGGAKTGYRSKDNGYSKTLGNLPVGIYILSYWQKSNGEWILNKQDVTINSQGGSTTGSYQIQLPGQVDEIRFHPKEALMSTFTYDPEVGITSSTNALFQTTYYEYDSFNRIILIRDENRNILQKYDYQVRNK